VESELEFRLEALASGFGQPLAPGAAAMLVRHLRALLRENEVHNLTSAREPEEALLRLTGDSLALLLHLREGPRPSRILDLGTGGGIPGVPCAVLLPAAHVVLLDRRAKKVFAAGRAARAAAVANVSALAGSLPELAQAGGPLAESADLVLARAVTGLPGLLEAARPALRRGGILVAWKGDPLPAQEESAALEAARQLGLEPLPHLPYSVYRPSLLVRYRRPA
jgi:16S rRNA (guanine527-N7)-methyltransferase